MPTEDEFVGVPRRRRRQTQGVSSSSTAEGTRDIPDEYDDADLNARVQSRAVATRPDLQDPHDVSVRPSAEDSPEFTPSSRLDEVAKRSSKYEREYRLKLLHRLLMRNVPLDEIAKELKVSVSTVIRDRGELYDRLKNEAQRLEINHVVGDTMGFYAEIAAMSLRIASTAKQPTPAKLAALRTALAAKNDMARFLQASGVFDVLQYRAKSKGSEDDFAKLMELTKRALTAEEGEEVSLDEDADHLSDDDDDLRMF